MQILPEAFEFHNLKNQFSYLIIYGYNKVKTVLERMNIICSFLTSIFTMIWFYAIMFMCLRFLIFIKFSNQPIVEKKELRVVVCFF